MRTIRRNFYKIRDEHPEWSDYVCLAETVRGTNFTRRSIYRYFVDLVNKEECDPLDTNRLVRHLCLISKQAEECTFFDKNALEDPQKDDHDTDILIYYYAPYSPKMNKNVLH